MIDLGGLLRLDGKVALVTGASRGIGLSTVEHLSAAGAVVVMVARDQGKLDEAVERVRSAGGRVVGVAGGVDDEAVCAEAVRRCSEEFGRLDILVNNAAAGGPTGPLIEAPADAVRAVVGTNQLAPLFWAQAAYRAGMGERGGAIVNVSSFAGLRARPGYGAYGQAKAALNQQTRVLALELAPRVRVNAVAPGMVLTELLRSITTEEFRRHAAEERPLRRLGEPADIARMILFLVSDAASWITGQVISVEGGAMLAA